MSDISLLKDKKVLVVDDEPDILAVLEELLDMCEIIKASSFDVFIKALSCSIMNGTALNPANHDVMLDSGGIRSCESGYNT